MNPYLSIIIGAVCISFAAIFVKWADVPPSVSGVYRGLYGTCSLLIIITIQVAVKRFPKIEVLDYKKLVYFCFLPGSILAVDLFFWHKSIPLIGAGLATLVANTQIFYAVLIGYFFFNERLTWHWKIILPIAFVGVALVGLKDFSAEIDAESLIGVGLACLAGICYSIFLMRNKVLRTEFANLPPILTWTGVSITTTLGLVLLSFLEEASLQIPIESHGILFLLGFVCQAVGWIFISYAMGKIPLVHSSFILLGQPALTTLWGFLFFNEMLTFLQICGVALVFTMIGLGQYLISKKTN